MTHYNAQVTMQRVTDRAGTGRGDEKRDVVEIFKVNLTADTLDELKELVAGHTALVRDNAGTHTRVSR